MSSKETPDRFHDLIEYLTDLIDDAVDAKLDEVAAVAETLHAQTGVIDGAVCGQEIAKAIRQHSPLFDTAPSAARQVSKKGILYHVRDILGSHSGTQVRLTKELCDLVKTAANEKLEQAARKLEAEDAIEAGDLRYVALVIRGLKV